MRFACITLADPGITPALRTTIEEIASAFGQVVRFDDARFDSASSGGVFVLVPPHVRGAHLAEQVLSTAQLMALRCHVGISDDAYSAFCAAQLATVDGEAVHAIPIGGAARFIANAPISFLPFDVPLSAQVAEAHGLTTIGDWITSMGDKLPEDWRALLLGEFAPQLDALTLSPVDDELVLDLPEQDEDTDDSQLALLRQLANQLAIKVAGRGRLKSKLQLAWQIDASGHLLQQHRELDITCNVQTLKDLCMRFRLELGLIFSDAQIPSTLRVRESEYVSARSASDAALLLDNDLPARPFRTRKPMMRQRALRRRAFLAS